VPGPAAGGEVVMSERWTTNTRGARRYRFDKEYLLKKAARNRRIRLDLLRERAPWLLLVGLVVSAALFVHWEAVAGMFRP
jgi:hypothetical protein